MVMAIGDDAAAWQLWQQGQVQPLWWWGHMPVATWWCNSDNNDGMAMMRQWGHNDGMMRTWLWHDNNMMAIIWQLRWCWCDGMEMAMRQQQWSDNKVTTAMVQWWGYNDKVRWLRQRGHCDKAMMEWWLRQQEHGNNDGDNDNEDSMVWQQQCCTVTVAARAWWQWYGNHSGNDVLAWRQQCDNGDNEDLMATVWQNGAVRWQWQRWCNGTTVWHGNCSSKGHSNQQQGHDGESAAVTTQCQGEGVNNEERCCRSWQWWQQQWMTAMAMCRQ